MKKFSVLLQLFDDTFYRHFFHAFDEHFGAFDMINLHELQQLVLNKVEQVVFVYHVENTFVSKLQVDLKPLVVAFLVRVEGSQGL